MRHSLYCTTDTNKNTSQNKWLRMKLVHESRANECSNSWVCLRTLELLLTKERQAAVRWTSRRDPSTSPEAKKGKTSSGYHTEEQPFDMPAEKSSSPRCVPEYLAAKIRLEIKEKAELGFFFLLLGGRRTVSQIFPWGIVQTSKQQNSLCQHSCQGRGHAAYFLPIIRKLATC